MTIVSDIVSGIAKPVADLISEFITDKDKANELAYKVATMAAEHAHTEAIAQLEINKTEAAHASIFVSGARPAAIWVCVIALFQMLVLFPLISYIYSIWGHIIPIPQQDTATMFGVLSPLLGLGEYRTYEKIQGVSRDSIRGAAK